METRILKKQENRGKLCLKKKKRQIFYVIRLLLWTQLLLKMISFLAHIDNQGGYAWNLPPQDRNQAKNPMFSS